VEGPRRIDAARVAATERRSTQRVSESGPTDPLLRFAARFAQSNELLIAAEGGRETFHAITIDRPSKCSNGVLQSNTRSDRAVESAVASVSCDAVYHNAAIRTDQHEHCRAERHEDCFEKTRGLVLTIRSVAYDTHRVWSDP
jgi:hypothetical protein